jgi:TM2 domain-containing membrane protein YozV
MQHGGHVPGYSTRWFHQSVRTAAKLWKRRNHLFYDAREGGVACGRWLGWCGSGSDRICFSRASAANLFYDAREGGVACGRWLGWCGSGSDRICFSPCGSAAVSAPSAAVAAACPSGKLSTSVSPHMPATSRVCSAAAGSLCHEREASERERERERGREELCCGSWRRHTPRTRLGATRGECLPAMRQRCDDATEHTTVGYSTGMAPPARIGWIG